MLLLGLFTAFLGFFNYYALSGNMYHFILGLVAQGIIFLLAAFALVGYKGKKKKKKHMAGYKIWTLPFSIIFLSFVENTAILILFSLNYFGYLTIF